MNVITLRRLEAERPKAHLHLVGAGISTPTAANTYGPWVGAGIGAIALHAMGYGLGIALAGAAAGYLGASYLVTKMAASA